MKKLPSSFEDANRSPGYQLWRVSNLWQRHIRLALKEFDLTHVQFVLLAVTTKLGEQGGAVNQALVAQAASTDKMMTSQVLRTLEEKGLVARTANPGDARAVLLSVTEAGHELIGRAIAKVEAADAEFFGVLGPDAEKIASLLHRLVGQG